MRSILTIIGLLSTLSGIASTFKARLVPLPFQPEVLYEDFYKIMNQAKLPSNLIKVEFNEKGTSSTFVCSKDGMTLSIASPSDERSSAFYKGLRELGFLFPHPLRQISPDLNQIKKSCGRIWNWHPTLKFRGFHLHTLHPSEWVAGFYQNRPDVAEAAIRWMARNSQNIFDLSLLNVPLEDVAQQMRPHFKLAQSFQIHTGVSLGIALQQQNSYKLLTLWDSYFGMSSLDKIEKGLNKLFKSLPLSYLILEAGSSEFTPTDYEKTLSWLELAGKIAAKNNKLLFTKVHVSSNQFSEKWGNYNLLPQFSSESVGVLPHSVMFYGMRDNKAPMYGNKNFHAIRDFMLTQKTKRPTWYYPETSYWVGMDVDIPLFLTDYLRTRAQDLEFLFQNKIEGQLNFTTGHALGYWLFDWNLALLTDSDYNFDPLIGIKLLGEDASVWKKLMDYQTHWYKEKGLISLLSSANLQDELSETHRIHERKTMRELSKDPKRLAQEIALLKLALVHIPSRDAIKNDELKVLMEVNILRHLHALAIRQNQFDTARAHRKKAQCFIRSLSQLPTNYPNLPLFSEWKNPTSYQFGYLYTAETLYFWEREERQLKKNSYFPFWGNIYDVWDILF